MSNLAVKKTNVVKNNLNIYISAILGVFLAIALSYMFFYKYLRLMSDEQEVAFIEGSNTGIAQLVVNDLSVIFDEKKSLSELLIIKDYTSGDKRQSPNVKGNILYITRNNQPMMFNLKPISTFMYKVLAQDYYYQLKLNRNLLGANIENQEFLFSRVYKLGKNNSFLLNLVPKDNSESLEFIRKKLQKRKIKLFVSFFSAFVIIVFIIIYIVKKYIQYGDLKKNKIIIDRFTTVNNDYLNICNNLSDVFFPISLPITHYSNDRFDVKKIIDEICLITEFYTTKYRYKYQLNITSEVNHINTGFDSIILKQIVISLIYNVLHFMRGGTHIKKYSVRFSEDYILIQYDSFAARAEHMCNWSKDLFKNLGNPYILDCKKIFELIINCRLEYEVVSCQGKNQIIINLNKQNENKIVQFSKNN